MTRIVCLLLSVIQFFAFSLSFHKQNFTLQGQFLVTYFNSTFHNKDIFLLAIKKQFTESELLFVPNNILGSFYFSQQGYGSYKFKRKKRTAMLARQRNKEALELFSRGNMNLATTYSMKCLHKNFRNQVGCNSSKPVKLNVKDGHIQMNLKSCSLSTNSAPSPSHTVQN